MKTMTVAAWSVALLLALLWTAGAWLAAGITSWLGDALASGTATGAVRDIAGLTVPEWTRLWVDPHWLQALQSALAWVVEHAGALLPAAGGLAGWVVGIVWVVWGLGMALLLGLAIGGHLLLRQAQRRRLAA